MSVLSFRLLMPDASALGTDQFPAPAAQTWRAVALALSQGLRELGAVKIWSMVVGGVTFPMASGWIANESLMVVVYCGIPFMSTAA